MVRLGLTVPPLRNLALSGTTAFGFAPDAPAILSAYDGVAGAKLWSHAFPIWYDPVCLATPGRVLVFSQHDPAQALDRVSGARQWTSEEARCIFSPVLAAGRVVFVSTGREVRALDPDTGVVAWRWKLPEGEVCPPLAPGTRWCFVASTAAATLFALDLSTGAEAAAWPLPFGEEVQALSVGGRTAYLLHANGEVSALDLAATPRRAR